MKSWHQSALSLCLFSSLSVLAACSGGGADSDNGGDIIAMDPPDMTDPPVDEPSGIVNTPLPFHEDFGDNLINNFDQEDTKYFFSPEYKSLTTAIENSEYEDPYPALWYPTCCFFDDDYNPDPTNITVDHENRLGIRSDDGNPSLLISNARVSVGQTLSELADPTAKTTENTDPKKDSTAGAATVDSGSWGELDLSQPYRVSFCVKAVRGGAGTMLAYVDSNHSNTNTGTSIHTSPLILNAGTPSLVPGQRVEINVPGDTTFSPGGEIKNQIANQTGSATSFLQFRVPSDGGAQVIIDDLLIESQNDNGQAELPACNTFTDATPPGAPEAGPNLMSRDGALAASWDSLPSAVAYDLAVNTSNTAEGARVIEGIDGTSSLIDELENGTDYYVFLRGVNSAGPGDWSPASSETPEEPVGCSPTTTVDSTINWGVWDGCLPPNEAGAVVLNGSDISQSFDLDAESEAPYFSAMEDGTTTMDTSAVDGSVTGDLSGVITATTYPKTFTWLGRIRTPSSENRGFEVEISFGETDGRRVKTILRSDAGKIQLEKFTDGSNTAEADLDEADMDILAEYHIYHVALTLNGEADVTARVYRDGENISGLFVEDTTVTEITGTGRNGGSSSPRLRIGDGSSSNPYSANVDWLIWTDDATATGLTPAELKGELPEGIGELGTYAPAQ